MTRRGTKSNMKLTVARVRQANHWDQCGSCSHWQVDQEAPDDLKQKPRAQWTEDDWDRIMLRLTSRVDVKGRGMIAGYCLLALHRVAEKKAESPDFKEDDTIALAPFERGDKETCAEWVKDPEHEWDWSDA